MNNKFLENYIYSAGFASLGGHPYGQTYYIIDHLSTYAPIQTGVMEIGVEQGRFFMALNAFTKSDQNSYAIDIFGDASLTKDHGAFSELQMFRNNLNKHDKHGGANVVCIQSDSTVLDYEKYLGKSHFISIDGAHHVEYVLNDLKIAEKFLDSKGVAIIDDFMWPNWISVPEAVVLYLYQRPTLVPFAFGFNKLYMCKISQQEGYTKHIESMPFYNKTKVDFCGHSIYYISE
jgi:hypothetical protein